MSKRQQKLRSQIGTFMRGYQRKARSGGWDPNDRDYDVGVEAALKRLRPEEADALISEDQEDQPPPRRHIRKLSLEGIKLSRNHGLLPAPPRQDQAGGL